MDWDSFGFKLLASFIVIGAAIMVIGFGFLFITSIAKKENYKCDAEKQAEFILKCITINPNNTDQPAIIEKCGRSAEVFCAYELNWRL